MQTRLEPQKGLKTTKIYKLITSMYLNDLNMDETIELMTHLDYPVIEQLEQAARVSLIDQEYNK